MSITNNYSFTTSNHPNPAKLIESLRHVGYNNYQALLDIIDNSIDAEADTIKINIYKDNKDFKIEIGDNGNGMDQATLDEALRLGSITEKNPYSDLGKFGMGLVTGSISIARKITVITKFTGNYFTSIVDIDVIKDTNTFVKHLDKSNLTEITKFDEIIGDSESGTLVILEKTDNIQNDHTTNFSNTLKKSIGRVHRHFLKANTKIFVNDQEVLMIDPLELHNSETEMYSDENYEITVTDGNGVEKQEMVHARIALIEDKEVSEREITKGINNQGFYVNRNNREILAGVTLDCFTKHNDFNRMRGEIFLTGELDSYMGIDFTKRDLVFQQSFKDKILAHLKGQCTSIKKRESSKTRIKQTDEVKDIHEKAEKNIDSKSKLLITPHTKIEKRQSRQIKKEKVEKDTVKKEKSKNSKTFKKSQNGIARKCRFEVHNFGQSGQIYECDLEGRTVVIKWNIDHPFYQRFILDQRNDDKLVTAVDFLIYSMASAELYSLDDDNLDLFSSMKSVMSSNVRTLLV